MSETISTAQALAGRTIIVPESRELDLFCRMLEQEGASTVRCPLVSIHDLEDTQPVEAWLDRLIGGGFDDVILLTGEGFRRIMSVAKRQGRADAAIDALRRTRIAVRGPKPAKALRDHGLAPALSAGAPTTQGLIATLAAEPLDGHRVGVQFYPDVPDTALLDFLAARGAAVSAIVPYRYASHSESDAVADVIRRMAAGEADFIAFTSSPQVKRLAAVAAERGLEAALKTGLERTRIAAVGPVVGDTLRALAGRVDVEPASAFHLKPLVTAIRAALATP